MEKPCRLLIRWLDYKVISRIRIDANQLRASYPNLSAAVVKVVRIRYNPPFEHSPQGEPYAARR